MNMYIAHHFGENYLFYLSIGAWNALYKHCLFHAVVLAIVRRRFRMSHVMNETEILEQLTRSLETDTAEPQTPLLPASRHEHSGRIAFLRGWITSMLQPSTYRQGHLASRCSPQFETPLDALAREHPYLFMSVPMS
jgi:hypothetical protein